MCLWVPAYVCGVQPFTVLSHIAHASLEDHPPADLIVVTSGTTPEGITLYRLSSNLQV